MKAEEMLGQRLVLVVGGAGYIGSHRVKTLPSVDHAWRFAAALQRSPGNHGVAGIVAVEGA